MEHPPNRLNLSGCLYLDRDPFDQRQWPKESPPLEKKNEMDWIDRGRLFGGVFDNVWFKESSLKERDLQDKLWMLEVVNNGNWTEREFNLVWNYTHDFKIRARSASSIWNHKTSMISDQNCTTRSLITTLLQHFEIAEFSQYQIKLI